MLGVGHGDLDAGERLECAALVRVRHQVDRHLVERGQPLVHARRRPDRRVVGLLGLHSVAEMIAMTMGYHDQVDLADLAEVRQLGRNLDRADDPDFDISTGSS